MTKSDITEIKGKLTTDPKTGEPIIVSDPMPAAIIKARLQVMKEAHGVGKTGRNAFHNYDYASDFDVLSLVQPAMVKAGLMLEMWPELVEGPDDNGNMWVRFMMQWQHESGVVAEPKPWWGIAQDRDKQGRMGDKWFNKAATAAEKYFLLKQFHIPAGKDVDPDHGKGEDNPYKGKLRQRRADPSPGVDPAAKVEPPSRGAAPQREGSRFYRGDGPEAAYFIPVPTPENGQGMEAAWKTWIVEYTAALNDAADTDEVNAIEKANEAPLEGLQSASEKGYAHVVGIAWQRRKELEQTIIEAG